MLISTNKRSRFGDFMNQIHGHCLQVWQKASVMQYNDRNKTSFSELFLNSSEKGFVCGMLKSIHAKTR